MWELDCEESWVPKNWCFWTVRLEKTLESPLDCKEIQPVHPKGDQSWVFIGRNDAKAETPILWPPHEKSWLTGKDSDAGRDWGQEEKGTTEDEMAGWHHQLDAHEFGWTLAVGDGQGGLACCNSWGHKESDTTERLDWTELNWTDKQCGTSSDKKPNCYSYTGFWASGEFRDWWPFRGLSVLTFSLQVITWVRLLLIGWHLVACLLKTSLVAQMVKRLSTMWETWVQSLGWEYSLEKEMATHSSTLTLKIPWMEELGAGYYPWGPKESGHDWATSLSLSLYWSEPVIGWFSESMSCLWVCKSSFTGMSYQLIELKTGSDFWPLPWEWKKKKVKMLFAQSYLTFCNPMHYSPLSSFIFGILQVRILEWVAIPFSRGSSLTRSPALQADSWPSEPLGKHTTMRIWELKKNSQYSIR